jgi:hypothetical protein
LTLQRIAPYPATTLSYEHANGNKIGRVKVFEHLRPALPEARMQTMPKATDVTITPTRRRALAYGAYAAICGLAPLALAEATKPTEENPDLELIRLCEQLVAVDAAVYWMHEQPPFPENIDVCDHPVYGPRARALWAESNALSERIKHMTPTTIEGARAIARAALAGVARTWEGEISVDNDHIAWAAIGWLCDDPDLRMPSPRAVA